MPRYNLVDPNGARIGAAIEAPSPRSRSTPSRTTASKDMTPIRRAYYGVCDISASGYGLHESTDTLSGRIENVIPED